jgi:hypothetical protein
LGDAFAIVVGEDVAVFTEAEETGELGVLHGWLLVNMGGDGRFGLVWGLGEGRCLRFNTAQRAHRA